MDVQRELKLTNIQKLSTPTGMSQHVGHDRDGRA